MSKSRDPNSDKDSITVHGSVSNAALVAGRDNAVEVSIELERPLPPPESVDIHAVLATIAATLRQLASPPPGSAVTAGGRGPAPNAARIEHALVEAEQEVEQPAPDRKEVGRSLDRALEYAKAANGFADAWIKLEPHVLAAASWLGVHGLALLRTVGLS
jgi:hypothetical protein